MFKICARTVLELGAELISSDVIAFYELIKNAFDARSSSGAEIRFEIVLRRNDYLKFLQRAVEGAIELDQLKSDIENALDPSAPQDALDRFRQTIDGANNHTMLVEALNDAYATENRIIVSDEGTGMSRQDLMDNYLVIGTASRKRAIDAALAKRDVSDSRPPFLGEKGIGRLSAMRLGDMLTVETAEKSDKRLNLLRIDWSAFSDLDARLEDIDVAPESGDAKPDEAWSGTRLMIGTLTADWTFDRIKKMGEYEFARLTDPFADAKLRPRIAIFWNDTRVPVAHMDRHLLASAHATAKGKLIYKDTEPVLECTFEALDLGFKHSYEKEKQELHLPDLQSAISGTSKEVPVSALDDLGAFEFEAYWFNRQRLGRIDTIGDQNMVRALQRQWSGILLFRDGFRVLPYGEDDDDWLALDRRALGSTGYLLNKAQFVGRVKISRLGNPLLVDQTNREGLRVCPEQEAFIGLLQLTIQSQLRNFLKDIKRRHKDQSLDISEAKTDVTNLKKRATVAIRQIKRKAPEASETIEELEHTLFEISGLFDRAQKRIAEVEGESRQMVQMAGVGLLIEVVAHELARSTENALAMLDSLSDKDVPDQISGLLESLRSEMKSVSKRVRVLDPLSVSGRQRKEVFNIGNLIDDILSGHKLQFVRHHVKLKVTPLENAARIRAVKGMIVQILENLLSNSLYWLDLRKQHEPDFEPRITITFDDDPLTITYEDNGRGVAKENREKVFRAFFSLKEKSKRRGLGLFIARECAEYHDGTLTLDKHVNRDTGRLHRFVLELPDKVVLS